MVDTVSRAYRSEIMARVGSRDTKPELYVRSQLHLRGFRFRVNVNALPGNPDIVLPKYQTVVFVHGCFWHGHQDPGCGLARTPQSNVDFWREKVTTNRQRDMRVRVELEEMGWKVLVIWECELEHESRIKRLADEIILNPACGTEATPHRAL